MTALHSQRNCWCGERHEVMEAARLNVEHVKTVAEATVLGPYEEEIGKWCECCCGEEHPQVAELGGEIKVTVRTEIWLVPRIYIAAHGIKSDEVSELAIRYGWKKVGAD